MQNEKLLRAFWERTVRSEPDQCWLWDGYINPTHGYGELSFGPRGNVTRWRAHRLSYFLHNGEIPTDLVVMHKCDNRKCVNPHHLSLGTVIENNLDMMQKGRNRTWLSGLTKCLRGHPLEGTNVHVRPNGRRECNTCRLMRQAKTTIRRQRVREARYGQPD